MCAAEEGHVDVVDLLLTRQVNVNIRRVDGFTALGVAELRHHPVVAQKIREAGGKRETAFIPASRFQ